jgi:hypothetical protein
VESLGNGVDGLDLVNDLAGGETLDGDVVATAGGIERVGPVAVSGLHDDDLANGGGGRAVGLGNKEVGKGAEKIAGSKLENGFSHGDIFWPTEHTK